MSWLVIGIGNTLRRDDGLGPWLAQRIGQLRIPKVTTSSVHQLAPEWATEIAKYDRVLFLDACETDVALQIVEVEPSAEPNRLGHALTPGDLLALAGSLGLRQPKAWMAAVGGSDFGFGEELSSEAAQRAEKALPGIVDLLRGAVPCTKSAS